MTSAVMVARSYSAQSTEAEVATSERAFDDDVIGMAIELGVL